MPITELVRIIDADPDLAEGLSEEQAARARRHLIAEVASLDPGGDLDEVVAAVDTERALGLLILEGLVIRRVEVVGHAGVELLGPSDVILPWQPPLDLATLPARTEWKVCARTRVAILDEEFHRAVAHFPGVVRHLLARLVKRSNTLALNLALAQLPRVEERLLVLFSHLADRFGRVGPDGVVIPLRISHSTLGELVYARRPSVTTALNRLAARGLVVRDRARGYVLRRDPRHRPPDAQRRERLVLGLRLHEYAQPTATS
jgi:CRP/FNR family transcriptional regulator, cyclic AMP receptor protein